MKKADHGLSRESIREKALSDLTASSLVMTLLATMPNRSIPVQALLNAGTLFNLSDRSIRVALTRLGADRKIISEARGYYSFAEGAEPVRREVADWRNTRKRTVKWSGKWVCIFTGNVCRTDRRLLRRHERALRLRGLREFEKGLWLRPDNLRGGSSVIERDLLSLGLAAGCIVFLAEQFNSATLVRISSLWEVKEMEKVYTLLIEEMEDSRAMMSDLTLEQTMVETLSIGRYVIRQILLDPLLPEPLRGSSIFEQFFDQAEKYDQIGKKTWEEFMSRYI